MNTAEELIHEDNDEPTGAHLTVAPDAVEVRRNGGLAALVGACASAVAIAYLSRAAHTGAVLDWVVFAVLAVVGAAYLRGFVDARTPLLVADTQGVRIRLGRTWRGLPWGALADVEHTPRRGLFRDGRLVLEPRNVEKALAELDAGGRRQAALSTKMYGAPFAVPLGLTTRVVGAGEDLTMSLQALAAGSAVVVESLPEPAETSETAEPAGTAEPVEESVTDADATSADLERPRQAKPQVEVEGSPAAAETDRESHEARHPRLRDPRPTVASGIGALASRLGRRERNADEVPEAASDDVIVEASDGDGTDTEVFAAVATEPTEVASEESEEPEESEPTIVASATPAPLRMPRLGRRTEVTSTLARGGDREQHRAEESTEDPSDADQGPRARPLRHEGRATLVEDTVSWGQRVRPIARAGEAVEPLVVDDFEVEPADDPVIGPELLAARTRLGLSIDRLADRTRIRPHVLESIEVDDFAPCGGDFYARGHLRTLARVLGIDVTPILKAYDERYADAPISPRRVFEAELATGMHGSLRSTRGGPNWTLLIGAVMALVLAWSVARLIMDDPNELRGQAPVFAGSPVNHQAVRSAPVPVKLTASGAAHVVVRDADGEVVFAGDLVAGATKQVEAALPVTVKSSDGGVVTVRVDGEKQGPIGEAGLPAKERYDAS